MRRPLALGEASTGLSEPLPGPLPSTPSNLALPSLDAIVAEELTRSFPARILAAPFFFHHVSPHTRIPFYVPTDPCASLHVRAAGLPSSGAEETNTAQSGRKKRAHSLTVSVFHQTQLTRLPLACRLSLRRPTLTPWPRACTPAHWHPLCLASCAHVSEFNPTQLTTDPLAHRRNGYMDIRVCPA